MPHIEGYADFLVELTREKLGYDANDNSHDDEVLAKLQAGEKLSKSKHMQPAKQDVQLEFVNDGIVIIDGKWFVDKESYDNVWKLYGDLLDKSARLYHWFEKQHIDVDELLDTLPSIDEINNG